MQPAEYELMDEAEADMWWYRALHVRLFDALGSLSNATTAEVGMTNSSVPAAGITGDRATSADATKPSTNGSRATGRLLDAGCGTGGFLAVLGTRCPDLAAIGVELDLIAVQRAKRKSGAVMLCGSVNVLPFADASFDAAVSADVLCHAAINPAAALRELKRVLRPGGRLVVNMPAYQWLLSAHDRRVHNVRRLTAAGMTAMLSHAGFLRVRARYWNGLLLPIMVVQRKILARGNTASDVAPFRPWLDTMLHGITKFERRLPFPLPAGGSVMAIAEKP